MPDDDPRERRYREPAGAAPVEVELPEGDVTEGVVRVGGTVRRPHQPQSPAVAALLDHLEHTGFEGSPRYLGRDERGRDVLTYLDGDVAGDPPQEWATTEELLVSVAELLRRLHDAVRGFLAGSGFAAPYGGVWHRDQVRVDVPGEVPVVPELIGHNDVTQQNVVVRDGRAVGLVDFDMAGPTTRLLDVVVAATWWAPLRHPHDLAPHWAALDGTRRLRLFADAYGLAPRDRARLPDAILHAHGWSYDVVRRAVGDGHEAFARMWEEGGAQLAERTRRWLGAQGPQLRAALGAGRADAVRGRPPGHGT